MENEGHLFEQMVRRVATQLWPGKQPPTVAPIYGLELDGLFFYEEQVHCIEATVERRKAKAEHDIEKLKNIITRLRKTLPGYSINGWFITRDEPTADQISVANRYKQYSIRSCSYKTFYGRLINAGDYLNIRMQYPFGSIEDPITGKRNITHIEYIPVELTRRNSSHSNINLPTTATVDKIVDILNSNTNKGVTMLIAGDFGIGKSVFLREIFLRQRASFFKNESQCFPVLLNLRDHHGQSDPEEALERHAKRIGFQEKARLVHAWRAGFCMLLLDGYDELLSSDIAPFLRDAREARYVAATLFRNFVKESPDNQTMVLSGREHYYINEEEMISAMGIKHTNIYTLNDFTKEQAKTFLQKSLQLSDSEVFLPDWLPPRPLLLGYFAAAKILELAQKGEIDVSWDGAGWDHILDRIAEREAAKPQGSHGASPRQFRELIETLALAGRANSDPRGELSDDRISVVYQSVFHHPVDSTALNFLQRFAGLRLSEKAGFRKFIDQDFYEAAQAGAVFRGIVDGRVPYDQFFREAQQALSPLAARVAWAKCLATKTEASHLLSFLQSTSRAGAKYGTFAGDVLQVMIASGQLIERKLHPTHVCIRDTMFADIDIIMDNFIGVRLEFEDCIFGNVNITCEKQMQDMVIFNNCGIETLTSKKSICEHIISKSSLSVKRFEFDEETNDQIMSSDAPIGVKVLKTSLRKLFMQSGSGRANSAFYRGIGSTPSHVVTDVLAILKKHQFCRSIKLGRDLVWYANRVKKGRALNIISSGHRSDDPVIAESSIRK